MLSDSISQLQHHPALTIISQKADDTGRLQFDWTIPSPHVDTTSYANPHHSRRASGSASLVSSGPRFIALLYYVPQSDSLETLVSFPFWLDYIPEKQPSPYQGLSTPQLIASHASFPSFEGHTSDVEVLAHRLEHAPLTPQSPMSEPGFKASASSIGLGTPMTDYLSPRSIQQSATSATPLYKRASWQPESSTSFVRQKRFSFQSDTSQGAAVYGSVPPVMHSPAISSDGQPLPTSMYNQQLQQQQQRRPTPQRSTTSPHLGEMASPQSQSDFGGISDTQFPSYLVSSPQLKEPIQLPSIAAIEEIPEDGPLFKAHCKSMEEKAYYLRRSLKHFVKAAESVLAAMRTLDETEDSLDFAIHHLAENSPDAVRALNEVYWDLGRKVQGFARKESIQRLEELLLDPLRRMVVVLKAAETKRKVFEQESKAYYEHVSRVSDIMIRSRELLSVLNLSFVFNSI